MANPTCPTSCAIALLPVKYDVCAPKVLSSEIKRIFWASGDAPAFTDYKLAPEWATRLASTATGSNIIRELIVSGDMAAPSDTEATISNRRTVVLSRSRSLAFTSDDMSDENYEFFRSTECGGQYRIWFETYGGMMYGGNEGILMSVKGALVLGRGEGDYEKIDYTGTWKSKFSPERAISPIFVN
jgi:hypothetical protein